MIMTPGETIQGRYRLVEALGSGGMATVWRAHDERLNRDVALKCLDKPLAEDPAFLVRFFAEAQAVAKLSHPNVVRVLDFGEGEDFPYLVMEFVPGGSVGDLTGSPVDPARAIELITGAARGAGAAHAAGLVHRDLKPENILIADTGIPKIGDFGIAVSEAQERLTATGTAIGSPHYVSPEQASGRPVGPTSDVYSLGVVLYELVTGVRPFEADNATALAIAHVEKEPQPPSSHVDGLAAGLDDLIMRCLAKDPTARFDDGHDLAAALGAVAADPDTATFAIAAAPVDIQEDEETPSRNVRRIAAVATMAAAFVALLVFGVMALGGRDGGEEKARASDHVLGGTTNQLESPKPTKDDDVEEEDDNVTDTAETPTPTPTESVTEESTETPTPKPTRTRETTDEETPEPTSEPTTEPTSAPTP